MTSQRTILRTPALDNSAKHLFEKFVTGYIHRINQSTFKVDLKQIHLDIEATYPEVVVDVDNGSLVVPIFAFESMPKRLSRFYVLSCLALFFYEKGSDQFYSAIEKFEPNYKYLERQFTLCFERNVKEALLRCGEVNVPADIWNRPRIPRILVGKSDAQYSEQIASHCNDLLAEYESKRILPEPSMFFNNSSQAAKADIKSNTISGAVPVNG